MSLWQPTGIITGERELNPMVIFLQVPIWLLEDFLTLMIPIIYNGIISGYTAFVNMNDAARVVIFLFIPMLVIMFIITNFIVFF